MSENFERLGNYILLEKINSGGMAEVYLSKSIGANGVNKFLAIKRILPQYADNKEFIEMFKEEAKIAVNLNHNNVVSIIDFKASQNQLYLVMEYVQGQNLRQILQQKKKKGLSLSLDFIVYVIREIAAGLDHAHRCVDKATGKPLNIIHRDMSPQNIMISYDGEVKIVDFGIAKAEAAGEATRVGTLKGKFSYMSPEQAEGLVIDQISDIFSLGIILWELIADDRLFVANNEMNILKRIKECDVPELRRVNPTVPIELERIVKKSLMKDKSLRYQTSSDLQKDLTRFLNKEYPDFTPSDFSTFMKFLFESEYSMAQERIVNYARLDFGSMSELSESTQFTKPVASSGNPPPLNSTAPSPPPLDMPEPPSNLNPSFGQNIGTFPKNQGANAPPSPPPQPRGETGISSIQTTSTHVGPAVRPRPTTHTGFNQTNGVRRPTPSLQPPRRSTSTGNSQLATRSGVTSTGIRYRARAKPPASIFAIVFYTIMTLVFISGGAYFASPKKLKTKINQRVATLINQWTNRNGTVISIPNSKVIEESDGKGGQQEIASTATVKMLIRSVPGRAQIYVNSIDQGVTTPATIEVQANKPFTLTLLSDGYLQHTTRMTAVKDGQELSVTLTKIKYGYVDINVVNAGIDTIVSIDGVEIKDRPPITRRPVPAGKPVKITANHPFAGTAAEAIITVGVDEKKTVDLILGHPAKDKVENKK